jgi:hypothetical protein
LKAQLHQEQLVTTNLKEDLEKMMQSNLKNSHLSGQLNQQSTTITDLKSQLHQE